MAKSSFSLKFIKSDKKSLKKGEKVITKSGVKIELNLTTKTGDSGSAETLGEKCVIIEAPKTDTKIDQNKCTTRKSDKKQQKSTKQKKWKK